MEIRQVVRGGAASPAPARQANRTKTGETGAVRPSTDRVELSRQWVEQMEEQRARSEAALRAGAKEEKKEGLLDMLDGPGSEELDAQMEALKTQQKCMEIAMRIMQGKRVPPEDEQYLMEHDPDGYKLAVSMRVLVKVDDEECESVLEDEDKERGGTSEAGGAAPAETGESAPVEAGESAPVETGESAPSGGEAE